MSESAPRTAAEPAERNASRSPFALRLRRALIAFGCVALSIASSRPSDAATVVVLNDGSRIVADQLERLTDSKDVIVRFERPGIQISRRIKAADIRSITVDGFRAPTPAQPEGSTVTGALPGDRIPFSCVGIGGHIPSACLPPIGPGVVIGVRDDPLSAYEDSVIRAFPHDVPQLEVEYALELMRAERARDVLMPLGTPPPGGAPGDVPPPAPDSRSSFVPSRNRVRSIVAAARPMNANGKVDFDSLEIEVRALDLQGRDVPVHGTIDATLWSQRQNLVRSVGTILTAEPGDIVKLGEWTRVLNPQTRTTVAADGNTASSLRFVVPLSHPVPDHDFRVAPFGDLHVKLSVPGEGVFEATAEGVALRHGSAVRGQRLVETGSHFLPGEGTSDNIRPAGSWRFTRPTSGPDRRVLSVEP